MEKYVVQTICITTRNQSPKQLILNSKGQKLKNLVLSSENVLVLKTDVSNLLLFPEIYQSKEEVLPLFSGSIVNFILLCLEFKLLRKD